ncbi:MAG: VWA domain-containing protein [Planctomycetota bacterium]
MRRTARHRVSRTRRGTLVTASALALAGGSAFAQSGSAGSGVVGPTSNTEGPIAPALDAPAPAAHDGPVVQLALLLDTSNSMDGLIDQARAELWTVVNRLQGLRHAAGDVRLHIALYQYGNDTLESADGFVQLRAPFTTDLDVISEQLFALRTDGGNEYCGWAIGDAVAGLDWIAPGATDEITPALRMIVIAGNEPFSQGSVAHSETIARAVDAGVRVHTVYCGPEHTGRSTLWEEGATMGDGFYFAIDQGQRVAFRTEYDDQIILHNNRLNTTYSNFTFGGQAASVRQLEMDAANEAVSVGQLAERAAAKATSNYDNRTWDITDAFLAGELEEEAIEQEALPEDWQGLPFEVLTDKIQENAEERERINKQIRELYEAREAEVAKQRGELGIETLGTALSAAIIEQAREMGFRHTDDEKAGLGASAAGEE